MSDQTPEPPDPNPPAWTTKDGRTIPVAKMSDEHLVNTIRYLRRRCIDEIPDPPCFNGEMAQYYAEQEWAELADRPRFPPQYEAMLAEAAERELPVKEFDDIDEEP